MAITYVTTGAWGAGTGVKNPAATVDENFWTLYQLYTSLSASLSSSVVSIASFSVSGRVMTITLTDSSIHTVTLPVAQWNYKGAWAPSTSYAQQDIITNANTAYLVLWPHTSASTFDPGANDGAGHNYYGTLVTGVSGALPSGGSAGQALVKNSSTDYDAGWKFPTKKSVSYTGTAKTLAQADENTCIRSANASAQTFTIPADPISPPFDVDAEIEIIQEGAGGVTVSPAVGVTLNIPVGSTATTAVKFATIRLKYFGSSTWSISGDLG